MRFSGRLFGPGRPKLGTPIELGLADECLRIPGRNVDLSLDQVKLRRVGFDEGGIELAWSDAAGEWALHVLDRTDANRLLAALPAEFSGQLASLRAASSKRRSWRRAGWLVIGTALAAPLIALALFLGFSDNIAELVTSRISIEQERALGKATFSQVAASAKLRDDGEAARVVREIGGKLTRGSRYSFEFHVIDDAAVNAYVMPGGFVVVHSGLIKATKRPEELAAVLAHEVQHVELRHSLRATVKQLGLGAMWALATGDLGSTIAGDAAQRLLGLSFSRDAESQADEEGFRALVKAGIDPSGMPAFFSTLAKDHDSVVPTFLSTHPSSSDRQERLAAMLRTVSERRFEPIAFRAWPPALN